MFTWSFGALPVKRVGDRGSFERVLGCRILRKRFGATTTVDLKVSGLDHDGRLMFEHSSFRLSWK